jgi:hypothetical protein
VVLAAVDLDQLPEARPAKARLVWLGNGAGPAAARCLPRPSISEGVSLATRIP